MKRYNQVSKEIKRYSELPTITQLFTSDGFRIWQGTLFTGGYVTTGTSYVKCKRLEAVEDPENVYTLTQAWAVDLDFFEHNGTKLCYISYHNESGRLFGVVTSFGGNYIFELDPVNGDVLYYELTNITGTASLSAGEVDSQGRFWIAISDTLYRFNDMRDSTDRDSWTASSAVNRKFSVAPDGSFVIGTGTNYTLYDTAGTALISGPGTDITVGYGNIGDMELDKNHIYASSSGSNNIIGKIERDKTLVWSQSGITTDGTIYYMHNFRDQFLVSYQNQSTSCRLETHDLDTGDQLSSVIIGSNAISGYDVSCAQLLYTSDEVYLWSTHYRVGNGAVLYEIHPTRQKLAEGITGETPGATHSCSAIGGTNMKVKC